jgi:peptidylprolyl isomerase
MVPVGIFFLALLSFSLACSSPPTPTPRPIPRAIATPTQPEGPNMLIDTSKTYIATLKTDAGDIVIKLAADLAPITVNNFVSLARKGYYNESTFHRVIPGFMAQGGDPTGTGSGGPGYTIEDEYSPELRHDKGSISMANTGRPNSGGSQFFITYEPTHFLDGYNEDGTAKPCGTPGVSCHAVFGHVTDGMDVVEALKPRDPGQNPNFLGTKLNEVVIEEQ